MKINFDNIKKHYDETFVKNVSEVFNKFVDETNCDSSFKKMGYFMGRNDDTIDESISDYFNRDLYSVNICVIDYILKNKDFYKDKIIIDNGSGFGLLSVYLKYVGINVVNYEPYTQLTENTFIQYMNKIFNWDISIPSDKLPSNCDVIISSGIWIDNEKYISMRPSLFLIDTKFRRKNNIFQRLDYIDTYTGNLVILGKERGKDVRTNENTL